MIAAYTSTATVLAVSCSIMGRCLKTGWLLIESTKAYTPQYSSYHLVDPHIGYNTTEGLLTYVALNL